MSIQDRIGRLGFDPELKTNDNGSFWRLSLARTARFGTKDATPPWSDEVTEWISVAASERFADTIKQLYCGNIIGVIGPITEKKSEDGSKTYQNMSAYRIYLLADSARPAQKPEEDDL